MHRQVASLIAAGGSPGRLAKLGNALGNARIDIATTGGAEWKHSGPITLIIKADWGAAPNDELGGFADVMETEKFPWLVFRTIEVELEDKPGSLGAAATLLDNINIYAVTILESRGDKALVGLGVRPTEVGLAIDRLKDYNAQLRRHPNDPADDGWWDDWDARTEKLLPDFEKPNVRPNDPRYYRR